MSTPFIFAIATIDSCEIFKAPSGIDHARLPLPTRSAAERFQRIERVYLLSRSQTKRLLKELDRLGHALVFDVLNDFFEALDETRRVGFDIAARWDPAHLA